jgi:hypothetical protein
MKMKLLIGILSILFLSLVGCSNEKSEIKNTEIKEKDFTINLNIEKDNNKFVLNPVLKNTSNDDMTLSYGRGAFNVLADNKPIVDTYRLDLLEKTISKNKTIEFQSIEISNKNWNSAKDISVSVQFDGKKYSKNISLK